MDIIAKQFHGEINSAQAFIPHLVTPNPGIFPYVYVCEKCNSKIFGAATKVFNKVFECTACYILLETPGK